jgi:hypothetical protein
MSAIQQQDADIDAAQEVDVDDIEGAHAAGAQEQLDTNMADADEAADGDPYGALCDLFGRLKPAEQQLFSQTHMPVLLSEPRAPPPAPQQQQPVVTERALPPPHPKYDGSSNWASYSVGVQAWLLACGTQPQYWGQRAFVCLDGAARDYMCTQVAHGADLPGHQL